MTLIYLHLIIAAVLWIAAGIIDDLRPRWNNTPLALIVVAIANVIIAAIIACNL